MIAAYIRWVLQAPILVAAYVFCYLTCWLWAAVAATFKLRRLPGPMKWVHTQDDTVYGSKWLASNGFPEPTSWQARWTGAMWWICRNPAYGFACFVLGYPESDVVSKTGNAEMRWCATTLITGGKRFSFRYQKHGVKIWLGWQPDEQAGQHIMKFNISPSRDAEEY